MIEDLRRGLPGQYERLYLAALVGLLAAGPDRWPLPDKRIRSIETVAEAAKRVADAGMRELNR